METVRLMLLLVGSEKLRMASNIAKKNLIDDEMSMSLYGKFIKTKNNLFKDFIFYIIKIS